MADSRDIASSLRMIIAQHPDGLRVLRDVDAALAALSERATEADFEDLSDDARQIVQRMLEGAAHLPPDDYRKDNDA